MRTPLRWILVAALVITGAGCTTRPAPPAPAATSAFGGTDTAWIEIMIAMDEQVQPLLDVVGERHATVPAAARVRAEVVGELPTLRKLHDEAGLPARNPHVGMIMPGLISAEEVARVAALPAEELAARASADLAEFVAHRAELARSEVAGGREERTRALARRVLSQ